MITPYIIDVPAKGNMELFICNEKSIAVYDSEYDEYFLLNTTPIQDILSVRPATKKELQEAGVWDMVINKSDFSNIDEELDSYFEIGDNLENRHG